MMKYTKSNEKINYEAEIRDMSHDEFNSMIWSYIPFCFIFFTWIGANFIKFNSFAI